MPTTNARGHKIPTGTEASITRATIFQEFGESIRDVVAVANTTARSQLVTDLATAGETVSSTRPLVVYRHDAPGLHRIEYTADGSVWLNASGVLHFTNKAAADSWATSNGGYLGIGDKCRAANVEYTWSGTAWIGGSSSLTFAGIYSSSGGFPVAVVAHGRRAFLEGDVISGSATFLAGTGYTLVGAGGVPAGFRPPLRRTFACSANATGVAAVTIQADGSIDMVLNVGFTGALALDVSPCGDWRVA